MRNTFNEAKRKATKKAKQPSNFMKVSFDLFEGQHFHVNVLLVPLAVMVGAYDHYKNKYYHSLEWDEKKATKVLDKALPKVVEYDEDADVYWFSMNWGTTYFADKAPLGLRTWARKYSHEVKQFIKEGYENPNYVKSFEDVGGWEEWVKFESIDKFYISYKKDNQEVTGERQAEMEKNIPEI